MPEVVFRCDDSFFLFCPRGTEAITAMAALVIMFNLSLFPLQFAVEIGWIIYK